MESRRIAKRFLRYMRGPLFYNYDSGFLSPPKKVWQIQSTLFVVISVIGLTTKKQNK